MCSKRSQHQARVEYGSWEPLGQKWQIWDKYAVNMPPPIADMHINPGLPSFNYLIMAALGLHCYAVFSSCGKVWADLR